MAEKIKCLEEMTLEELSKTMMDFTNQYVKELAKLEQQRANSLDTYKRNMNFAITQMYEKSRKTEH